MACKALSGSRRSSGSMTSFQIPVKGSGRVRQVRGDFRSAGSSPRCHLPALRTLIPAAAAAAS